MSDSHDPRGRSSLLRSNGNAALGLIATELAQVEEKLTDLLVSREPLLSEIAMHLIGGGGKRVRPAVALLVFKACGGDSVIDMVDVAVALELIHSATLLHDDIIDGGKTRRGRPSAFSQFGLADTLVTGDFLFSKAFELCGRFEENIVRWAADACVSLTEGEIMQGRFRRNPSVTVDDYLEIIARKTASLFSQGARVAAHLAGAGEQTAEAMWACGFNIGMAFQVVDDLLDVEGDEGLTGKPVGIDLRDGNPSLPLVLALERDETVRRVFLSPEPEEAAIADALQRVRALGVLPTVRRLAEDYTRRARTLLAGLPYSVFRESLDGIITEIEERRL
ncbi:MAG TPA: polyprenyl synthetase family protein [Candidatus Binatia bacterium]